MRWSVYARISEDRTGEEWGVARQLEDIHRVICARDDAPVITEFIENDTSAYKNRPRPKFDEMMALVESGGVDVICAKHMDRLLRRLIDLEKTLEACEATGTYIITTHDGVDTSTEGGRLVARILASVAQGEVERKKARQISAARQAASQGRWTGGRRPFGYKPDGGVDEEEARLIRAAYARVLTGGSLYSIASEWNQAGVATTMGNKWTGATVRQMLTKPRYAGLRAYRGEVVSKNLWDPIVDEDIWTAVSSILNAPNRQIGSNARKYLLTGLVLCGCCGKPLGSGANPHRIYRCKHCAGVSRAAEPIERLVVKLIKAFLASDQAQELLIDRSQKDVARLMAREKVLYQKMDQLAVDMADDLLTARQVKVSTDKYRAELDDIANKLEAFTKSSAVNGLVLKKETWESLTLDRQRAVVAEVAEFTLHPAGKGRTFEPQHLTYRWLINEE